MAAHLGLVDESSPAVPFDIGGAQPDYPRDAVLLLEGYDRRALHDSAAPAAEWLKRSGLPSVHAEWTSYDLAYLVAREDLPKVIVHPYPTKTS